MEPDYYVFTGRERVPRYITHARIDRSLKFVPARAFYGHPNIEELICHDGVGKVEEEAFRNCPSLQRVIIPGVKEVEKKAFNRCSALTYIECGKLERIGEFAFSLCKSLSSIDLPSIKILKMRALSNCTNLINVTLGIDLESIVGSGNFFYCTSLDRIAIPMKDGIFAEDDIFQRCAKLTHIDLVGGVHETVAALLLEEWKNDMNEEIDAINRILPNTPAGDAYSDGGKAREIRRWITSVLHKIIHYKAEHRRILNEASVTLQGALPNDIVLKSVLPFLELPSYTFPDRCSSWVCSFCK